MTTFIEYHCPDCAKELQVIDDDTAYCDYCDQMITGDNWQIIAVENANPDEEPEDRILCPHCDTELEPGNADSVFCIWCGKYSSAHEWIIISEIDPDAP